MPCIGTCRAGTVIAAERSHGYTDLFSEAWAPPEPKQKHSGWILTDDVAQEIALSDTGLEELDAPKLTPVLARWSISNPAHQRIGERLADLLFKSNEVSSNPAGEVDSPRHAGSDWTVFK